MHSAGHDGDIAGPPRSSSEATPVDRRVIGVADAYLAELATLDPHAAQALGHGDVILIPDLSPEAYQAHVDLARRTRAALDAVAARANGERVLAAALADRLDSDIALDEVGFTRRLLAPLATPVHRIRHVFDNLPRATDADWQRVAEHLALVPRALDQYRRTLLQAADDGHVVARRQVLAVAAQCEAWVEADDYFGRFAGSRCPDEAAVAARATAEFAAFLRGTLAPRAGERDGVGPDVYNVTARSFLGARLDLDEVYAFGWDELARIGVEMRAVATEIIGEPNVAEAMAHLDADPARQVHGREALEEWLQARVEALASTLDGTHFDIPAATRVVECRLSPATSGVMYYTPPDPGLTRPGRIWWSVPDLDAVPVWREVGTLCHEGLPGHHLQYAVTLTTAELHPWQRVLCHVHGYAEGWAHYAERLADEIGLYTDPAERLGMLSGQMWRAARIVIDIGLHLDLPIPVNEFTGATRWTPDLAVDILTRVAGLDVTTARFEVDRYLGWPGQALAFKVGERLWWQARRDAEQRPGFERKRFHMTALRLGPMGLDPLRSALADTSSGG